MGREKWSVGEQRPRDQRKSYALARLAAVGKRPVTIEEIRAERERKNPPGDGGPAGSSDRKQCKTTALKVAETATNGNADVGALAFMRGVFRGFDRQIELPAVARVHRPGDYRAHRPSLAALDGATHASAGLYQRAPDGGFACSKAMWTGGAALMLDDVGAKVSAPLLPPSWVIETSPGSQQWGFCLDEPLRDQATFAALFAAAADAGLTDPGAVNPTRWFRLPGSQPAGKQHRAKLILFNPDIRYSVAEIVQALGLSLNPARHRAFDPVVAAVPDAPVADPLLAWLYAQGLVIGDRGNGWVRIYCPWASEHTGCDDPRQCEAEYHPPNPGDLGRAFTCHHSHDPSWEAFLAWVVISGGPAVAKLAALKGDRYE